MQLTADEETQAIAILHQCGIEDDDARTALENVCAIAGDTRFQPWLDDTRALANASATSQSLDAALHEYGSNQIRVVRALATYYPTVSVD